jgi:RNA polymerase sigma-70 factor (ECF subfamily)
VDKVADGKAPVRHRAGLRPGRETTSTVGMASPSLTGQPEASPPDASLKDHGATSRRELATLLPELRTYARFLVRDRTGSDDLVQDTIVRALGAIDQFQPDTSLKAWVFTILRNAFYEQERRRQRETAAMATHAQIGAGVLQQHHGEIGDMSRLLWTLPPLLREALVLVGAQELTHEEAALVCDVPIGTMRARVSRARSKLSQAFGDGARPWEA